MADQQPDPQAAAALAAAYQRQVNALRQSVAAYISRLWRSLGTYRQPQMHSFTRQALPVVLGGQRKVSAFTVAYLAGLQRVTVGGAGVPVAVNPQTVTGAAVRNGTAPVDVYERPFHLVWRQLDELPREPGSIDQAMQAGLDRAVQSALTDLQLAKTHTSRQVLAADKRATGYRRVLEGAHSCALCVVASTQRYHKADLLPMHPTCDCSIAPLYSPDEHVIDSETLAAAHAAVKAATGRSADDARAVDYRDFVVVHQHGELGPVLTRKGAPFLGPHDL